MSYMSLPRIHFAGTFVTKPSTVNNTATNYQLGPNPPSPVLWNPNGNAVWLLESCTVTGVVDDEGKRHGAGGADPLVGQPMAATDNWGGSGVPAKIVDLDPQQQTVSMLYGLQIETGSGNDSVTGDFRPMWFQDLWGQGTNHAAGTSYQSVLESLEWGGDLASPALRKLRETSPDLLSIKFTVDQPSFVPDNSNPNSPMTLCRGRITGTIGPAEAGAPDNFVVGRYLRPPRGVGAMNYAPAFVDLAKRRLTVDLGNSIPWAAAAGNPPDLGNVCVAVGGEMEPAHLLGAVDYSVEAYATTALVQDFTLSEAVCELIGDRPISVVRVRNGDHPVIVQTYLEENPDGVYINASPYVFRMEANGSAEVELIATEFGTPIPDFEIELQDASGRLTRPPSWPPVGTPPDALQYDACVKTGPDGRAKLTLSSKDPGNPRGYIDGQVYGIAFKNPTDTDPDPNNFLSVLVHDSFDEEATWENLKPIMQQYARLYPFMNQNFFQLDDPAALQQHAPALIQVFGFPFDDPRYMPVVRDLSDAKKEKLIAWLKAGAPSA